MVSSTPKAILTSILSRITIYDKEEAGEIAFRMLEKIAGIGKTELLLNVPVEWPESRHQKLSEWIQRINTSEPIQYILGEQWFRNRIFQVAPGVLIPRPETEELVDIALKACQDKGYTKMLDIGTGSGCIAISMSAELKNAEVWALDISDQALEIARRNAGSLHTDIVLIKGDILAQDTLKGEKFDLILSNPPYIRMLEKAEMNHNVLNFEPHLALFVTDEDPLVFYRAIARRGKTLLNTGGLIITEINSYLGTGTKELFEQHGYHEVHLLKDFTGRDRFVSARL